MKSLTEQMIDSMLPIFYDYYLTVGEDGVVKKIVESGVDLKNYPKVAKRVKQIIPDIVLKDED